MPRVFHAGLAKRVFKIVRKPPALSFSAVLQTHVTDMQTMLAKYTSPRSRLFFAGGATCTAGVTAFFWSDIKRYVAGETADVLKREPIQSQTSMLAKATVREVAQDPDAQLHVGSLLAAAVRTADVQTSLNAAACGIVDDQATADRLQAVLVDVVQKAVADPRVKTCAVEFVKTVLEDATVQSSAWEAIKGSMVPRVCR